MDILKMIEGRAPRCLSEFRVVDSKSPGRESSQHPRFKALQIHCQCGAEKLHLRLGKQVTKRGLFKKSEEILYLAPIEVECPSCAKVTGMFDPRKHGYDGEMQQSAARVFDGCLTRYSDEPCEIIVSLSYQGEEFDEFDDDMKSHLEDYFDTFTVYAKAKDEHAYVQVTDYECA